MNGRLILLGHLQAHIANFSMYKKKDGSKFKREDFIRLNGESGSDVVDSKPNMKLAKQRLGGKFNLN